MRKRRINAVIYHVFVFLFALVMIYPVLWMIFGSFKTSNEILNSAERLLPETFSLDNYITGWKGFAGYSFSTFFKNSAWSKLSSSKI